MFRLRSSICNYVQPIPACFALMPPKPAAPSQSCKTSTSATTAKRKSKSLDSGSVYPFEKWSVAKLQAEAKKYGFKTSRSRDTLIDRLKAVYQALDASQTQQSGQKGNDTSIQRAHVAVSTSSDIATASRLTLTDNGKRSEKGKGRKSDPFVLASSSSSRSNSPSLVSEDQIASEKPYEPGDLTLQLEQDGLSHTDSSQMSESSDDIPLAQQRANSIEYEETQVPGAEATLHFSNTMADIVKRDSQLWLRILRFEPISFDEFVSVAVQSGIDMDSGRRKEELRSWLDKQCVCFYTAELTGTRSRH